MNSLQNLNAPQLEAVQHNLGPLLILAGPGSGKTRVITYRIAHLIQNGVWPSNILALTFTNKAAREMNKRVEELTAEAMRWISTFHSFCAKILRMECSVLGFRSDFTIYDQDDSKRALKQVLMELNVDYSSGLNKFLGRISRYKNKCITPSDIEPKNYWERSFANVYKSYQDTLKRNNALDFDDLLLKTLELFTNYNDVLRHYQAKFRYILVDEFQDTNLPQYKIAKALGEDHQNICATGDPDQSIYSWRGANLSNILNFEKDFSNTKTIKLEQNYRSTKTILEGAQSLISNNKLRKPKKLWTDNEQGQKIQFFQADDDQHEGEIICKQINNLKSQKSFSDIAILYRTNAQSRAIETALTKVNIPYIIIGGVEFYQRAEIKDVLAYLKVLINPDDEISLLRIINTPARSIGKKTIEEVVQIARRNDISIYETLKAPALYSHMKKRPINALQKFVNIIEELIEKKSASLSSLVEILLEKTDYWKYMEKLEQRQEADRMENVKEFVASVKEFEQNSPKSSLTNFLEQVALISDLQQKKQSTEKRVTLMTLHAAKGLEFPIVFVIGVAEGVCPHSQRETFEELEEERRLLFVGMTRAKELLNLSYAKLSYRNASYGFVNRYSRFINEIPSNLFNQKPSLLKRRSTTSLPY